MELILNEFSLAGQFESLEEDFLKYFKTELKPMLDVIAEQGVKILKKTDFYDCKITKDISILQLLNQVNSPLATILKSYIVKVAFEQPFWDEDVCTCEGTEYQYPVESDIPNCFTEAVERQIPMYSFPHEQFDVEEFSCMKSDEGVQIKNIRKFEEFLQVFLMLHMNTIPYVLEKYPYPNNRKVECAVIDGKCYAEEALLGNDLKYEDFQTILMNIPNLMDNLMHGEKTNLWDAFGKGLFEYRVSVSSERIFRLFFIQADEKLIFLSGFIKKTQRTPKNELDKVKKIVARMK